MFTKYPYSYMKHILPSMRTHDPPNDMGSTGNHLQIFKHMCKTDSNMIQKSQSAENPKYSTKLCYVPTLHTPTLNLDTICGWEGGITAPNPPLFESSSNTLSCEAMTKNCNTKLRVLCCHRLCVCGGTS